MRAELDHLYRHTPQQVAGAERYPWSLLTACSPWAATLRSRPLRPCARWRPRHTASFFFGLEIADVYMGTFRQARGGGGSVRHASRPFSASTLLPGSSASWLASELPERPRFAFMPARASQTGALPHTPSSYETMEIKDEECVYGTRTLPSGVAGGRVIYIHAPLVNLLATSRVRMVS